MVFWLNFFFHFKRNWFFDTLKKFQRCLKCSISSEISRNSFSMKKKKTSKFKQICEEVIFAMRKSLVLLKRTCHYWDLATVVSLYINTYCFYYYFLWKIAILSENCLSIFFSVFILRFVTYSLCSLLKASFKKYGYFIFMNNNVFVSQFIFLVKLFSLTSSFACYSCLADRNHSSFTWASMKMQKS